MPPSFLPTRSHADHAELQGHLDRLEAAAASREPAIFSTSLSAYEIETSSYDYARFIFVHPEESFLGNARNIALLKDALRAKSTMPLDGITARQFLNTLAMLLELDYEGAPFEPADWATPSDAEAHVRILCLSLSALRPHVITTLLQASTQSADEAKATLHASIAEPWANSERDLEDLLYVQTPSSRFILALAFWMNEDDATFGGTEEDSA